MADSLATCTHSVNSKLWYNIRDKNTKDIKEYIYDVSLLSLSYAKRSEQIICNQGNI